jgi:hypothetical protein
MKRFKTYYNELIKESIFKGLSGEEATARMEFPYKHLLIGLDVPNNQAKLMNAIGTTKALTEILKRGFEVSEKVQIFGMSFSYHFLADLLKNGIIPSKPVLLKAVSVFPKPDDLIWTLLTYGMEVPDYIERVLDDEMDFAILYQWFMESAVTNGNLKILKTLNSMREHGNENVPENISELVTAVETYFPKKKLIQ